ncbi:MAG: aquaporin Z [Acidimicrobiia bacterium]|nr:MAG: aquaporin Z [Acidimicrobiia bacterium]
MPVYTRKLVAELLGTYVLLLIGGFAIFAANIAPGASGQQGTPLILIALGFGLALLVGLYAFGEVSGGHYNPAVSLAMLIDGRIDVSTFIMYVIAQVGGAVLAGLSLAATFSQDFVASTATVPNTALGVSNLDAFLLELLFTAFFVAVILKVTESTQFGSSALIAIPLTLVVIHIALVPLTGSSVNPARTLGSGLVGSEFTAIWVYMIAPLIGAFIGWAFFKLVTLGEGGEA